MYRSCLGALKGGIQKMVKKSCPFEFGQQCIERLEIEDQPIFSMAGFRKYFLLK